MLIDLAQHVVDGIIDGALIAVAAIGLSLVFSVQRFANVSQAGIMSTGAYFALIGTSLSLDFWLALIFATVLGAGFGVLVFALAFSSLRNATKVTLLVASIGVDLIIRYGLGAIWGRDLRGYPVENLGSFTAMNLQFSRAGILMVLIALAVMLVIWSIVRYTRIGREMRAVSDLPELARLAGISARRVYLWVWALVGASGAVAGVCIAWRSSLYPDLGWGALLVAFAAAILGGIGDIRGAAIGGFLMGIATSVATVFVEPTFKPAFGFIVMALILLVRPQGLFGKAQRV